MLPAVTFRIHYVLQVYSVPLQCTILPSYSNQCMCANLKRKSVSRTYFEIVHSFRIITNNVVFIFYHTRIQQWKLPIPGPGSARGVEDWPRAMTEPNKLSHSGNTYFRKRKHWTVQEKFLHALYWYNTRIIGWVRVMALVKMEWNWGKHKSKIFCIVKMEWM